ncbi:MAG: UvrD-helicase domain-containing protein, partial [Leptolinea sp.]
MSVRTRFAPSPTGYLHVGGLRTALYAYLFAKQNNGTLILRIEDTDQSRKVEGATEKLIEALQWAGIDYDEGPGKDGNHGPYIQSERLAIYRTHSDLLLKNGKAYHCFCSAERLEQLRSSGATMYDRQCRAIPYDEAQQRAVDTIEGPVLIVAGAGTGKTRVITQRILNIIKKGVAPFDILAITFTNKAASEMRERVRDLLENDKTLNIPISTRERPFISTFHSLGVHIIRENATLLGLTRNFTIFDRGDSKKAIKEALVQCSIDPKQFDPGTILNMISRAKGDGIGYLQYQDHAKGYMEEIVSQVWEKYDAKVASEKALDFDDLLLKTANILEKNESVRKHYSNIWKYIHVDEYQDTNRVQYK